MGIQVDQDVTISVRDCVDGDGTPCVELTFADRSCAVLTQEDIDDIYRSAVTITIDGPTTDQYVAYRQDNDAMDRLIGDGKWSELIRDLTIEQAVALRDMLSRAIDAATEPKR